MNQKGQLEKKELQLCIDELEEKEQALQARIEALQADNDFSNERLTALQGNITHTHTGAADLCCVVMKDAMGYGLNLLLIYDC